MSVFVGTCERCTGKTPVRGRGPVLCDSCKPAEAPRRQFRTPTPRPPQKHTGPCCDECGTRRGIRKSQRLDPRNLRPTYALLCPTCATRLGYSPVQYGRPFFESKGREGLKGAV